MISAETGFAFSLICFLVGLLSGIGLSNLMYRQLRKEVDFLKVELERLGLWPR